MSLNRREFLKWFATSSALGTTLIQGCSTTTPSRKIGGQVVVIGGGYAGATAAKYIRKWGQNIEVTLIERNAEFISCPLSNLVLSGSKTLQDLTISYDGLAKYGIKLIRDDAISIDPIQRSIKLLHGNNITYDRLIIAPGIDFMYEQLPGLNNSAAQEKILHAWKAGPQTVALQKQLEAMKDGQIFAMTIPKSPYRCPPGPYERACQIAYYFKTRKPRSKILILDANDDIQSKKGLFTKVWDEHYKGIIEYRPNSILVDVDANQKTAKLEFDQVKADVLNVIPTQRAGTIAGMLGMANANGRFCNVNFLTYESTAQEKIHIIGDAIQAAPGMPKSGHMANQQAKICAAAIVALLNEQPVNNQPIINNTCYSFINDREAMHVASVHRYDATKNTMLAVDGTIGVSPAPGELEGQYGFGWAKNIWADSFA